MFTVVTTATTELDRGLQSHLNCSACTRLTGGHSSTFGGASALMDSQLTVSQLDPGHRVEDRWVGR